MRCLVTGGAGFIGSLTAERLLERGDEVIIIDDLSTGNRGVVPEAATLHVAEIGDRDAVRQILEATKPDSCIHFAGLIAAGESMVEPARYFAANVGQTLVLFDELARAGVDQVVFSSSAAVYGEPQATPMTEAHPTVPTSVYGATKLQVEHALEWVGRQSALRYAALRYFNAAGGTEGHAEQHAVETHLIPLAMAAAAGHRSALQVFGTDYPTPDGTCIRDYVHVEDLASAHLAALDHLGGGGASLIANLGTGRGYSVREVLATIEEVTGEAVPVEMAARRPGDPAALVAGAELAAEILGWVPQHSGLAEIIADAWLPFAGS
jgi:UDP-glucose 4-epimerase